jgi:hypothetical protein
MPLAGTAVTVHVHIHEARRLINRERRHVRLYHLARKSHHVDGVRRAGCLELLIALNSGIPRMCTLHAR